MSYPVHFVQVTYSDFDPVVWCHGYPVTEQEIRDSFLDSVRRFKELVETNTAAIGQPMTIDPHVHFVKSALPAAYWCKWPQPGTGERDLRGWGERLPDGNVLRVDSVMGQGCDFAHIQERLVPTESDVPWSDSPDHLVRRIVYEVIGGQGETDAEHGGGCGGGVAGGAWYGPDHENTGRDWGFGLTGGWRRKYIVLAKKLHGVDVWDPSHPPILDKFPDCRDRLGLREYPEPRPNGGFMSQADDSFHHEALHGFNVDIHNPDLQPREGGGYNLSDEQRRKFVVDNAAFLIPVVAPPPPPPPPPPSTLTVTPASLMLRVGESAFVTANMPASFSVSGRAATVSPDGLVTAVKQGGATVYVRAGGQEIQVPVSVKKRWWMW